MKKFLLNLLGALWVLPATILVWTFYILPLWLIWRDLTFKGWYAPFIAEFQLAQKDIEPWHARLWKDWYGVGLPCAFVYKDIPGVFDDELVARVRVHENRHCMQWFAFGIFFYPLYLLEHVYQQLVRGDGYKNNRFEVDARRWAAGEEIF